MARLQLAKQELQDMRHVEAENDILIREVQHLKKELAIVQEKINENMEAVCYQLADLMWFFDNSIQKSHYFPFQFFSTHLLTI